MHISYQIQERPFKTGYLRRQVSSLFEIWVSEYYYLDGNKLLMFPDEKSYRPMEIIEMSEIIVDGPWKQEDFWAFTFRSGKNLEELKMFSTFSQNDAIEWVHLCKNAAILAQYELQYQKPSQTDLLISQEEVQVTSLSIQYQDNQQINQKFQPHLPKEALSILIQSSENARLTTWTLKKRNYGVNLFQDKSGQMIKAQILLLIPFELLRKRLMSKNMECNFFCKRRNVVVNISDHQYIQQEESVFIKKGITYNFISYENKYIVDSQNFLLLIKQSVDPEMFSGIINVPKTSNQIITNIEYHILYVQNQDDQNLLECIVKIRDHKQSQIINKFYEEVFLSLGSLKQIYEEDITSSIYDKLGVKNNLNLSQTIDSRKNSFEIQPFKHSFKDIDQVSLQSRKSKTSIQLQPSPIINEYNRYLIPQDRKGYVDYKLQQDDPAIIYQEMHKRINHLSDDQIIVLNQFRNTVNYLGVNDNTLIRSLQARGFNIKDATLNLTNMIKWRQENNILSRRMEDYPQFIAEDIHIIIGEDKFGHPILYEKCCNSHPEKMSQPLQQNQKILNQYYSSVDIYMQFHQGFVEEALRRLRGDIDCAVIVFDCYLITMKNFSLQIMKKIFHEVFNYYVERLFKIYVLHADFLTKSIYRILKPFLPARTVEKIIFVGNQQKEIFEKLSEDFDIDVIPKRYGGNNNLVI